MINIELDIFNLCATAIEALGKDVLITNVPTRIPDTFPSASVYEQNNVVETRFADSSHSEKFATLTYVADVCSNKTIGAKAEAKELLSVIDGVMYNLNFTRVGMVSTTSDSDNSYYRITARYQAVADSSGKMYRR